MKIASVVGARPQFIKAATISRELANHTDLLETVIHTGQHFDSNMSEIFFNQMQISKPRYNLAIDSLPHGAMTGRMLEKLESVLIKEKPDWIIVYGDTNSTIAGALAARKLNIKIAHVEAGLRSFNMKMPEEINRVLTDRISNVLFCPTNIAVKNLINEGFQNMSCEIVKCGDVMYDAALFYSKFCKKPKLPIPQKFILATCHRAENTNSRVRLENIFSAFDSISQKWPIILPLHPRTQKILKNYKIPLSHNNIKIIEPVGYLEMLWLLENSKLVMTDSGGLQKEAYFFGKTCLTLREETEWTELVQAGINRVCGADKNKIIKEFNYFVKHDLIFPKSLYGNGKAAKIIVSFLVSSNSQ